jgi:hypothetical protein
MAATYQSVSITTWQDVSSGSNLTITKPTGLAVGDYLLAHLTGIVGGSDNADSWDTPSGWTLLHNDSNSTNLNSSVSCVVFYKIADSGDAAASNFLFTKNGNNSHYECGALYRISGANGITSSTNTQTNDATPAFNNTITPVFASSLLLFLVSSSSAGTGAQNVSSYAITNDNPTWAEVYDIGRTEADGTDRGVMAGAWASRTQTTATGNSSCTLSQTQNTIGIIISFSPIVAASAVADVGGVSIVGPGTTTGPSGEMFSAHDSFNIGAISNGYSNVEFDIGITAVDVEDRRILNYTGTPTVSSTGTLSTGSGATVPFVAGELDDHAVKFSNTGSFTITVTDGSISGVSNSFDIYELTDIQNHKGDIFYPVKILPTLSNVRHINIIMAPVSGFSDNDLTLQEAAVKFYFNMSETPYCTKYVTRGDIKKGYVSFELNKQYVNSIQIEVEYFNEDNPRPSGGYSNHGVADFCPSYAEVIYERTDTIK